MCAPRVLCLIFFSYVLSVSNIALRSVSCSFGIYIKLIVLITSIHTFRFSVLSPILHIRSRTHGPENMSTTTQFSTTLIKYTIKFHAELLMTIEIPYKLCGLSTCVSIRNKQKKLRKNAKR